MTQTQTALNRPLGKLGAVRPTSHAIKNKSRVALHAPGSAATSSLTSFFMLLVLGGSLAAATDGFRIWDAARCFGGLAFGGVFAWMTSARLRYLPLVWGSPQGLDLEWAWGDRRHLDWSEVLEIRVNRVSSPQAKRYRVFLADEAFEFDARADFGELVTAWREHAANEPAVPDSPSDN